MAVHHVHVQQVRAPFQGLFGMGRQTGKVGGQDGRRDLEH